MTYIFTTRLIELSYFKYAERTTQGKVKTVGIKHRNSSSTCSFQAPNMVPVSGKSLSPRDLIFTVPISYASWNVENMKSWRPFVD